MNLTANAAILSGIAPDGVAAAYRSRKLEALSDVELFSAAAAIISQPKVELNSFRLHAPLELMARYSLLPLVAPADRELARLQIVAIVARYETSGETVPTPTRKIARMSASEAAAGLRKAVEQGDVELADALCLRLADEYGLAAFLDSITDLALRTLTGAAHTHIGLMLLARMWGEAGPLSLNLTRTGLRALAQAPEARLKPVSEHRTLQNPEKDLESLLSKVPTLPESKFNQGLRAIIESAEEVGLVDRLIGDALLSAERAETLEGALRANCRVAAYSMLNDSAAYAKYGWSHCLTMPQAAWALARFTPARAREAAHAATTWVIGFRADFGNGNLNLSPALQPVAMGLHEALAHSPAAAASVASFAPADQRPVIVRALGSEAAIRSDAHLVKYTRACLDAATQDPADAHLFHAAAAYLCSIWCREQPRERLLETL